MPNWVENSITIKGENENIEQFLSDAIKHQNGKITFSSWIPAPETFRKYDTTNYPDGEGLKVGEEISFMGNSTLVTEELIEEYKTATRLQEEQYGVVGWYDYNCKTYGCKWDCSIEIVNRTEDELTLYCCTPWGEPIAFFYTMSERYPELSFNMFSDSVEGGFFSKQLFQKGIMTVLEEGEYDFDAIEREYWKEHPWKRLMCIIDYVKDRCKNMVLCFLYKIGIIKQEVEEEDDLPF